MKLGLQFHNERLGLVTIVAIHEFGTVDVVTANGKYFRITGLSFCGVAKPAPPSPNWRQNERRS